MATPQQQANAFDTVVNEIIIGLPRQLANGLDLGDALWAGGVLAQLISAVRVFRNLPGEEKRLTVLRGWDRIQDALPATYPRLKSDMADKIVGFIYNGLTMIGVA